MDIKKYFKLVAGADNSQDVKIDLNDLAKAITLQEGMKESVNIAQVKEVLKITLSELAKLSDKEVREILNKYKTEYD